MTDFFTELERHLVAAAENDERRPRRSPRAVAVMSAVVLAVAVIAVPLVRGVGDEGPAGEAPAPALPLPPSYGLAPGEGCMPGAAAEPPRSLTRLLGVLRRPAGPADRVLADRMPRTLADQLAYRDAARLARSAGDRHYWVVPVRYAILDGRGCAEHRRRTPQPGACLYVSERRAGEVLACSTAAALATGHELTARKVGAATWELAGIMPDPVASLRQDDVVLDAAGSVVVGRLDGGGGVPPIDPAAWRYLDAGGRELNGF
jgi:hypothetical protein